MFDEDNLYEPEKSSELPSALLFEMSIHFSAINDLLSHRRETLSYMNHQYHKASGSEKDFLGKMFLHNAAEYNRLVVAEAQRIVDTHNPDGSLKSDGSDRHED